MLFTHVSAVYADVCQQEEVAGGGISYFSTLRALGGEQVADQVHRYN